MIMKCCNVQKKWIRSQAKTYPIIYSLHKLNNNNETKIPISRNVYEMSDSKWCNKHLRHTTTEKRKTMGNIDTSDLAMIITWAMDISYQSLKWASWTHTAPYRVKAMKGNHITPSTIFLYWSIYKLIMNRKLFANAIYTLYQHRSYG